MSWFSYKILFTAGLLALLTFGAISCKVQPLNADRPGGTVTPSELSGVDILDVTTRVGQQVRNHLIFGLSGGGHPTDATHTLELIVIEKSVSISVVTSTKAPTAAQVFVTANYILRNKSDNTILAAGKRQAIASYDRTSQSFANQRAERDAENRAAREVAEQLRLVIAATLAGQ